MRKIPRYIGIAGLAIAGAGAFKFSSHVSPPQPQQIELHSRQKDEIIVCGDIDWARSAIEKIYLEFCDAAYRDTERYEYSGKGGSTDEPLSKLENKYPEIYSRMLNLGGDVNNLEEGPGGIFSPSNIATALAGYFFLADRLRNNRPFDDKDVEKFRNVIEIVAPIVEKKKLEKAEFLETEDGLERRYVHGDVEMHHVIYISRRELRLDDKQTPLFSGYAEAATSLSGDEEFRVCVNGGQRRKGRIFADDKIFNKDVIRTIEICRSVKRRALAKKSGMSETGK